MMIKTVNFDIVNYFLEINILIIFISGGSPGFNLILILNPFPVSNK